jgi:hypothetical protein
MMKYLLIRLTQRPEIIELDVSPSFPLIVDGRQYQHVDESLDGVFYDFILNPDLEIIGVQLQVGRTDGLSQKLRLAELEAVSEYLDFSPFFRIWFGVDRNGKEAGVEGFGDLTIAKSNDSILAFGFSTWWLQSRAAAL